MYAQLVLDAEMSVAFCAPVGSRCQDFRLGFEVFYSSLFEDLLKCGSGVVKRQLEKDLLFLQ